MLFVSYSFISSVVTGLIPLLFPEIALLVAMENNYFVIFFALFMGSLLNIKSDSALAKFICPVFTFHRK